jgi:hypothetical protein
VEKLALGDIVVVQVRNSTMLHLVADVNRRGGR